MKTGEGIEQIVDFVGSEGMIDAIRHGGGVD
jgi:hypothetical protein